MKYAFVDAKDKEGELSDEVKSYCCKRLRTRVEE